MQVDQDQGQLWFAERIKAAYGVGDVFADAWSAPGFMKTNDSPFHRVTPYLTDTSHELSPQAPITVKNSAFTATLAPAVARHLRHPTMSPAG